MCVAAAANSDVDGGQIFPCVSETEAKAELLNQRFTGTKLAAALRLLLDETPERARMISDLAEARARLAGPDPIDRVCTAVQELLTLR